MRIDVRRSREMQAVILALRVIDRSIAKQVRQHTKAVAAPEWKRALAERAHTRVEQRVLVDTAVVSVSNQNVRVQSAGKGRPLRGGLNPKTNYPAVEFGASRKRTTYNRKSSKGGTHKVTRTTGTGLPARRKEGPFYGAARNMIPRIARLFVQTTVRTLHEATEGKAG